MHKNKLNHNYLHLIRKYYNVPDKEIDGKYFVLIKAFLRLPSQR